MAIPELAPGQPDTASELPSEPPVSETPAVPEPAPADPDTASEPPSEPAVSETPAVPAAAPAEPDTASEPPSEPPAPETVAVPAHDFNTIFYLGAFGGDGWLGLAVGGTFQYRIGPVVLGVLAEHGDGTTGILGRGYEYVGVAALGGLGLRPTPSLRIELLGVLGTHGYQRVGAGGWSSNPGVDGTATYGGTRAAITHLYGLGPGHFELGLYADFQDDVSRQRVSSTYWGEQSCLFGCSPPNTVQVAHVIGTYRIGVGVQIGLTYNVL